MDAQQLFRLIQASTASQREAMVQLEECEQRDGFMRALLEILSATEESIRAFDPTVTAVTLGGVRLMTVISIKNLVRRCWNSNRGGDTTQYSKGGQQQSRFLTDEEKGLLKQYLSSEHVLDRDDKVARQLCSLVGAVAKVDWPQGWPTLIPNVLQKLQSLLPAVMMNSESNSLMLSAEEQASLVERQRSLYQCQSVLGEVLEVLSHKRMPQARKEFQRVCVEVFGVVSGVAGRFVLCFTERLQMSLALAARLKMSQALATRSSPERQQGGSGADAVDGRDLVLEGYGMCACKWAQVLSLLLEQAYHLLHSAPAPAPAPASGDGQSGSSGVGLFMSHYLACMAGLADALRDAQLFCVHADSVAGRGWRSGLRFDLCANTDEDDEMLSAACDEAAQGAHKGLKAALCPARRALALLCEALVAAQREHCQAFAPVVGPALQTCYAQLQAEYAHPLLEVGRVGVTSCPAFATHCTLLLSNVLSCREYEQAARGQPVHPSTDEHRQRLEVRMAGGPVHGPSSAGDGLASAVREIRRFLAAEGHTAALLDLVLSRLLPLTRLDLTMWAEEPTEYVLREQSAQESNRSSVRTAAESLFLSVLENDWAAAGGAAGAGAAGEETQGEGAPAFPCNAQAVQYMAAAIRAAEASLSQALGAASREEPAPPAEQACRWDALFLCVGLGSATLAPALPYPTVAQWWQAVLAPLLQSLLMDKRMGSAEGCQLLRARLVWLLRCWYYHFETAAHPQMLALVQAMLEPAHESDPVVLLETVRLADTCLDRPSPALALALGRVCVPLAALMADLAARLHEAELQADVVGVLGKLVLGTGKGVGPLLLPLAAHCAQLWAGAGAGAGGGAEGEGPGTLRRSLLGTLSLAVRSAHPSHVSPELVQALSPLLLAALGPSEGGEEGPHDYGNALLAPEAVALWRAVTRASFAACSYSQGWALLLRAGLMGIFGATSGGTTGNPNPNPNPNPSTGTGRLAEGADVLPDASDVLHCYAILCYAQPPAQGQEQGPCAPLLAPEAQGGCGALLAEAYRRALGTVAPRAVEALTRPLKTLLTVAPEQASAWLVRSGVALRLLRACAASMPLPEAAPPASESALSAVRTFFAQHKEEDVALVSYLAVLAGLALCDLPSVLGLLSALHAELPAPEHRPGVMNDAGMPCATPALLLEGLVRLWLALFDAAGYNGCAGASVYHRRQWCLALLRVYGHRPEGGAPLVQACPRLLPCFAQALHAAEDLQAELASPEGQARVQALPRALAGAGAAPGAGAGAGADDDSDDLCWGDEGDLGAGAQGEEEEEEEPAAVGLMAALLLRDPVMTASLPAAVEAAQAVVVPFLRQQE